MRCAFCNRRIRSGDWAEFRKPTGGTIRYHRADSGPHRNCSAAARHRYERSGLKPTLFITTDPGEGAR